MNSRVLLSFVFVSLLVIGLQTTNAIGFQSSTVESFDANLAPFVSSPLDITYVVGSSGNSITWEIADDNPAYWIITMDGEILEALPWETNNETVTVDIDGHAIGNYMYKIYACDDVHNVTDIVLVSVIAEDAMIHGPISIYGNENFNGTAQLEGWIGNGTKENPFVIEKLVIDVSNSGIGIYGTDVHFIIRNCTFEKDGTERGIGLDLQDVQNGVIENCSFLNMWIGCISVFVSNTTWDSNAFGNLVDGIWLMESSLCDIVDNSFAYGGISLMSYLATGWDHHIVGNTIDERPIGYFSGLSSQIIDATDYSQVIVANCYEVEIHNGNFMNVGTAMSFGHSNFSGAYDCNIEGVRNGAFIERTLDITFDNCIISSASEIGLHINESVWTVVFNCTIENIGSIGIMNLMGSNTTIIETIVVGCGDVGIGSFESPYFYLLDSTIQDNNFGIQMGGCYQSEISGNKIQWNTEIGLIINWGCEGSRIFNNEFSYNGAGNALDDGNATFWDDGISIGNLWSDYDGTGFYYVPGSRGGIDHYPGGSTIEHYLELFDTGDKSYVVGTTGHFIVWEANCSHPAGYLVMLDDTVLIVDTWDGSAIIRSIDGLAVGEYNYTVVVVDSFGEAAYDTVMVSVTPATTSNTTTTTTSNTTTTSSSTTSNTTTIGNLQQITLIISLGSVVVIIVVIVLTLRTRKGSI